jgi:methylated-DNA-[protein]-cysteine S-methyltransferase
MKQTFDTVTTPIGRLLLVGREDGKLTHLFLRDAAAWVRNNPEAVQSAESMRIAVAQVTEYFDGSRRSFDLVLEPEGSEFQHRVWEALRAIPFGETRSYGQIAMELGVPNASRAVGRANATNPIGIVVPCHRVIGATGSLTGYAGGLDNKLWLLTHEGALKPGSQSELGI